MRLELTKLTANPDLQIRENVYDFGVVEDYAEAIKDGAIFPPVIVFFDGAVYWIADGFHRFAAAQQAHAETIEVDVREGNKRDAILYAVGANADNGLRRTNQDKRNAVTKLLNDKEWAKWSDREIARRCNVSNNFVGTLRPSLSSKDSERTYTTKHGAVATMDTSKIGHRNTVPVSLPPPAPMENVPALAQVVVSDKAIHVIEPLPTWTEDEPDETPVIISCGDCRFYKPDSRSDQFYCLALEQIHSFEGLNMPCDGKKYAQYQLGFCECCGQQLK